MFDAFETDWLVGAAGFERLHIRIGILPRLSARGAGLELALIGGAAVAWPLMARAQQQPAVPVIGVLSGRSLEDSKEFVAAFGQGLNEAGFFEHRNVAIEYRWAENHVDRLPTLAAEFVREQARPRR
jgi:hypothetical protein